MFQDHPTPRPGRAAHRINPRPERRAHLLAALAPVIGAATLVSFAQAGPTWDGGGGNDFWSTAANWNADALPPNNGSANLVFDGILRTSPDMNGHWTVNSLTFANNANAFTLVSGGNFALTLGGGGMSNVSLRTQVVDTAVTLSAPQTWNALARISLEKSLSLGPHQLTIDGVQSIRFGDAVSGAGSLRKNGSGTLILDGATNNSFSGGVTVNSGTLFLNKSGAGAMTAGVLTIGDGAGGAGADVATLISPNQLTSNVGVDVRSSGVLVGNHQLTQTGSITLAGGKIESPNLRVIGNLTAAASNASATIGAGTIDLFSGVRTWTVHDGAAAVDLDVAAGVVNGGVVKAGAGAMRMSGAGTYDGGMTINAGTLLLANSAALGGATVTMAGGALQADGGPRTIANNVNVTGASAITGANPITLNGALAGNATLTKTGSATLTIGGASSNAHAGGIVVESGTLALAKSSGTALGAGTLAVGDGAGTDTLVLAAPSQFAAGATIDVRSSGVVIGNGNFNIVSQLRMTGGQVQQPNLRITGAITTSAAATSATVGAGSLDFGNAVRNVIVADGAPDVDLDVAAVVRPAGGINKQGAGTMRLGAANEHTLGTTVPAGTLVLAHPSASGAGSLGIGTGAAVIVESGLTTAVRIANALTIASSGTFDLTDNDAVIDYSGASPIDSIRAMLAQGYAGGAWAGGGGGIITTRGNANEHGIAYAESSAIFTSFPATFCGQSVDDTSLLLRFTRYGDANLDGIVNLQDFNRLAANFGATGAVWSMGDFNYDGIVNLHDFNRLAANFGLAAAGPDVTPDDWALLGAAVPEPVHAASLIVLASTLARRRRA